MDLVLIKLLLAHFIGDFFLQSNAWVKDKEQKKIRSIKLYLHIAVHIGLIFIIFTTLRVWKIALIIGALHYLIDLIKLFSQKKEKGRLWFFIDQILHILSIILVWSVFQKIKLNFDFLNYDKFWFILLCTAFLTHPTAIIIKVIINKWLPKKIVNVESESLQDAGRYIGVLERLLIFLFIYTNHFEAVGFLLAAKSIFRFGDLKEAHDIKLTEYVLIGTLLSFGIALLVAISALQIKF